MQQGDERRSGIESRPAHRMPHCSRRLKPATTWRYCLLDLRPHTK